jgi:hypothetical protein
MYPIGLGLHFTVTEPKQNKASTALYQAYTSKSQSLNIARLVFSLFSALTFWQPTGGRRL